VTVENLAGYPVTGVEVAFSYPSGVDIELLDQSARASVLPPHGKTRFDLAMALGKEAPKVLPLRINVESDRFDLAHWPLELPTDGTAIALREPTIQARRPIPTSASVGSLPLRLHVSDERAVQNVVVMANGRKVAWAGGGKTSLELEAQVDLFRGSNRIVVMAEDDQGVQSSALYVVRGEPIVAVDAADQ
jgi:hypothetical protein